MIRMESFTINTIKELKEFLWESNIHDGLFTRANFDQISKTFTAHIENHIWNDSFFMVFSGIQKIIVISDFAWGTDETICCLTEIHCEGKCPFEINDSDKNNNLCFVWEMLSGNRIYIVCKMLEVRQGAGSCPTSK